MKVCVKNLLRPAHFLAFVFGICPYRKSHESDYRRSGLGTVLQLTNLAIIMSICVYIVLFYLPDALGKRGEYSSLRKCTILITQITQIFLSLWLIIHQFVWASKTLRCLQLADELNKAMCQISNCKQRPIAFSIAMVWSVLYLIKSLIFETSAFVLIVLLITMFLTMYCETLMLEFITLICTALDTINQKLQSLQTSRNCDINELKRLQSLYLKAAYLAEMVDNAFGISWLASIFARTIQIVVVSNWFLKLVESLAVSRDTNVSIENNFTIALIILRLAASTLRCLEICYSLHRPTVKRLTMVRILRGMIIRNGDNETSTTVNNEADEIFKMNEFTLQIALRKITFTAGGFFDMNMRHFGEIVGMWLTLLVIVVQLT